MHTYSKTDSLLWTGRKSGQKFYLHEKVVFVDLNTDKFPSINTPAWAILGYACDEGVKRNEGRIGAALGPDAIRKQLAKLPNHLTENVLLLDTGTVDCKDGDLKKTQTVLSRTVAQLLKQNAFPILLGGGHDIAYGHYNGIKKYLATEGNNKSIGIINFDAHFDLRSNQTNNNSGTPFYQIAQDCKLDQSNFRYMCFGIREDANSRILYDIAKDLGVQYVEKTNFNLLHFNEIKDKITQFTKEVDYIYTTIDLDGFSSAYAPGVSAASPMGFSPEIVLECLKIIIASKKLISLDLAEMNPTYDIDHQTAKLAASLVHFVIHQSQ
ncbi:formimidoylglutamase [Arenibacter sp. S6351L]|uniref:formimidoylglutamase n=1 Tax=Arenibacter sp. S6351L TaxID=2926407 RepID=UPI001FF5AE05|nr:formimidoylglutamase [Arenibacter sp. S6351L]MCK0133944.1 formimidoylglutamase [Arenibacter sp. S6351L]